MIFLITEGGPIHYSSKSFRPVQFKPNWFTVWDEITSWVAWIKSFTMNVTPPPALSLSLWKPVYPCGFTSELIRISPDRWVSVIARISMFYVVSRACKPYSLFIILLPLFRWQWKVRLFICWGRSGISDRSGGSLGDGKSVVREGGSAIFSISQDWQNHCLLLEPNSL